MRLHEPRPLVPRRREPVVPDRVLPGGNGPAGARQHLRGPEHGRGQAGGDQVAARARVAPDADSLHRRHGADQLRRHVHPRADRGHRPRGAGRLGLPGAAGLAKLLLRGARPGPACREADAELPHGAARRDVELRGLPRASHPARPRTRTTHSPPWPCAVPPARSSRSPTCPTSSTTRETCSRCSMLSACAATATSQPPREALARGADPDRRSRSHVQP